MFLDIPFMIYKVYIDWPYDLLTYNEAIIKYIFTPDLLLI